MEFIKDGVKRFYLHTLLSKSFCSDFTVLFIIICILLYLYLLLLLNWPGKYCNFILYLMCNDDKGF